MLNLIQIAAILQLLVAFGAPADRVQVVSDILYRTNPQAQAAPNKTVAPEGIGGVETVVSASFVDLKINGQDGVGEMNSVDVPLKSQTKVVVTASWTAQKIGFPGCALSRAEQGDILGTRLDPVGSKKIVILKNTTIKIECTSDMGTTSDYVLVNLIP